MMLVPSTLAFLILLNFHVTGASRSVALTFTELLAVPNEASVLARELAQHISDDNLSRAAQLLVSADKNGDAVAALGASLGQHEASSPTTLLLEKWSSAVDHRWPSAVSHGTLFDAAVRLGANGTGSACALITAARVRNVHALTSLLQGADARDVRACVLASQNRLFYASAASPTPGTARLFFRGGRAGVARNGAAAFDLRDAVGVVYNPDMWPSASKSALEAASPPVELDLLAPFFMAGLDANVTVANANWFADAGLVAPPLPAAWGPSPMAAEALLEREPISGLTPILRACESGRVAVLRRLLALLPIDATPRSDALQASPVGRGMTCAHLAAAAGHTAIIAALIERFPLAVSAVLITRDAAGRTPCQIADGLGGFLAPVAAALRAAGACSGQSVPAIVGCPRVPRVMHTPLTGLPSRNVNASRADASANDNVAASLRSSLVPRGFSARAHFAAGWRTLSPAALTSLSLPPDLLFAADEAAESAGSDGDDDFHGIGTDEKDSLTLAFACAPPELPASALDESHDAEEALYREFLSTKVPFIVRGAYDPLTFDRAAPDARGPSSPPSAEALKKLFVGETVDTGALPYASAYGAGGMRMPVDAFIASYMGSAAAARAAHGMGPPVDEARAVDAVLHSPSGADAFFDGPGADLSRPPYIFDGSIMKARSTAYAFRNFSLPRIFNKDNAFEQFVMGPPLSGAMPHFHGSAVNVLAVGVKLWVLVPPAGAAFVDAHAAKWFRDDYFATHARAAEGDGTDYGKGGKGGYHFIFTQSPGDLVYVPAYWGHAVLNLADTYALALE